jgi:hypothetical protein
MVIDGHSEIILNVAIDSRRFSGHNFIIAFGMLWINKYRGARQGAAAGGL